MRNRWAIVKSSDVTIVGFKKAEFRSFGHCGQSRTDSAVDKACRRGCMPNGNNKLVRDCNVDRVRYMLDRQAQNGPGAAYSECIGASVLIVLSPTVVAGVAGTNPLEVLVSRLSMMVLMPTQAEDRAESLRSRRARRYYAPLCYRRSRKRRGIETTETESATPLETLFQSLPLSRQD